MRIATTTIETFRLYLEEPEWCVEQKVIDAITRTGPTTDAMRLGTAFHTVLEDPEPYKVLFGYHCDGFSFPLDTMQPALDLIDRRGVFECKSTRLFGPHTVVAKADQVLGVRIYEHKTTTNSFDADKYLNSCQWRFEAAIFQPAAITYRVFLLKEPQDGIVGLRGIETLTVYPYPALLRDCETLLRQFVAYVEQRGLTRFLERPDTVETVGAVGAQSSSVEPGVSRAAAQESAGALPR